MTGCRPSPDRLPLLARCYCGELATLRSASGRWFCADHLPRRDAAAVPAPETPVRRRTESPPQLELPLR
ncbi:hypothetical protein [Methylobacterium sp. JK268]